MLESIYVGMTGLLGYSRGLRVIANNTANLNTPGFKSASLQFADLFYTGGNLAGGLSSQNHSQVGFGLNTAGTALSFKQGELRQTGNPLDMGVDGQGLFILRHEDGHVGYTRAGQFVFDADGVLVNRTDGAQVMGAGPGGELGPISLAGLGVNAGKATSTVKFTGNLSSMAGEQTVGGITVLDVAGATHSLNLRLTAADDGTPGHWKVDLLDGVDVVGSGELAFVDGKPLAGQAVLSVDYAPPGQAPMPLKLDFSENVSSFAGGNLSTLSVASQDGVGPGALISASFDDKGVLVLRYANGETANGARLALARFDSPDAVGALGDNQFEVLDAKAWHQGSAGEGAFGSVRSGVVEISNVDLSQEFSDLVIMQRGYQASSQVISTANDMLQELFAMKSK